MPSRADIVRLIYADSVHGLSDHATPDLVIEDGGGLRLGLLKRTLFPDLVVTVEEVVELDAERVMARLTISSRERADAVRWPGVSIFRFRGDKVCSVWTVADHMPWLFEVGALDVAELDQRFDRASEARNEVDGRDAPPPTS